MLSDPVEDRLVARYHSIWRLSYAGGLLAMIGLSVSFKNWASLLILCVPACAVVLWRIRMLAGSEKMDVQRENADVICIC